MALATRLPLEIARHILSYINKDIKTLAAVARTCKSWNRAATPILYQEIKFTVTSTIVEAGSDEIRKARRLLRTLAGDPEICKFVRILRYLNLAAEHTSPVSPAIKEINMLCEGIVKGNMLLNLDTLEIQQGCYEVVRSLLPLAKTVRTLSIAGAYIDDLPRTPGTSCRLKDFAFESIWRSEYYFDMDKQLAEHSLLNSCLKLVSSTLERIKIDSMISPKIALENLCFERAKVLELGTNASYCESEEELGEAVSELLERNGNTFERLCLRNLLPNTLRLPDNLSLKQLLIVAKPEESLEGLYLALPQLKQLTSFGIEHEPNTTIFSQAEIKSLVLALGSCPRLEDLTIPMPQTLRPVADTGALEDVPAVGLMEFGSLLANAIPGLKSLKIPQCSISSGTYNQLTMHQWADSLKDNKMLRYLHVGDYMEPTRTRNKGKDVLEKGFIDSLSNAFGAVFPELGILKIWRGESYPLQKTLEVEIKRDGEDISGVGRIVNWSVEREPFWEFINA